MLRFLTFLNNFFAAIGSLFKSPLLLILRLFFGFGFVLAGWGKLQDISKFADTLLTLQIPYPTTMAWLVALTELTCGAFLMLGFLSRIITIPLIIVMSTAYATAHVESIHALTTDPELFVKQAPFNFLLTALIVFAFGPGIFSLDALLLRKSKHEEKTPPK